MATSDRPPPLLVILQRWKSHRQLFRPDWGSSVWRTDVLKIFEVKRSLSSLGVIACLINYDIVAYMYMFVTLLSLQCPSGQCPSPCRG